VIEFWMPMGWTRPENMATLAQRAEADGWDGLMVSDTQCLQADPFVMMTLAAAATTRLSLSIAASNPVTRHPSVAACAAASVAAVAGERISYGIGRGDSALAYTGGVGSDNSYSGPSFLERLFGAPTPSARETIHENPTSRQSRERT